jgi:low affinity Fe/Cu permease
MPYPKLLSPGDPMETTDAERLSLFQRIADRVSYAMGTPLNITFWIVAVAAWIALGPYIAHHNFLPGWFTSNSFNFPLNTVTTIAELYIGFLVGASSNRSERNLEATLAKMSIQEDQIRAQGKQIRDVENTLTASLEQNTQLTQAVHDLTKSIHESIVPGS